MKKQLLIINLNFLFLLIFCNACNGQGKTNPPENNKNKSDTITDQGLGLPKTPAEMQNALDSGVDPYFVESQDTISIYGPQCIVRDLIQDKEGNIWLASWQGIIKYDGKVFTNYTLKEGLIHFHVGSLFEDSKGNIWFGCTRGGVYRCDPNADSHLDQIGINSFTLFTTKDGLPDNTINCITEDKYGNIWFGTGKGVSLYDGKIFTNFTIKDGLNDNYVNAIIKDKSGMMWFGTNNSINIYDGKAFTQFTDKDSLPFKKVALLFEDKNGNIWIGSDAKQAGGRGLCRHHPSAELVTGGRLVSEINPYFVMYMCQDKEGNLWLAHNKGASNVNFALYRYDGNLFTKVVEQDKPDNPVIFGIIEDNKGNTWFGTAKGVCRYDGKVFNYFREQRK